MRCVDSMIYLALGLLVVLALPAGGDEIDIENAPTPTRLIELLPEGGIQAVDMDVLTITEAFKNGGRTPTLDTYTHWRMKPEDGKLVIELISGRPKPRDVTTKQRWVYNAEGEFESYQEVLVSKGSRVADLIGKIEDDQVVIKPNPEVKGLKRNRDLQRSISLEIFKTHVPNAWIPLVRSYHIRAGNLGYNFATVDLIRNAEKIKRSAEDVGTESLTVGDQAVIGHLILEKRSYKSKRKSNSPTQSMVLKDGGVFSGQSQNGDFTFKTRRATSEEVRERFYFED